MIRALRCGVAVMLIACCTTQPKPESVAPKVQPYLVEITKFDDVSIQRVKADVVELANQPVVWIRINSFGGQVSSGLKLIQFIEDLKREHGFKTKCVVDMHAISMAFYFLQSPACDERLATNRSMLMVHKSFDPSGDTDASAVAITDVINEALIALAAERLSITRAELRNRIEQGDWFLTPEQAFSIGALDGYVKPSDLPIARVSQNLSCQ